jgi:hypothetical protein
MRYTIKKLYKVHTLNLYRLYKLWLCLNQTRKHDRVAICNEAVLKKQIVRDSESDTLSEPEGKSFKLNDDAV